MYWCASISRSTDTTFLLFLILDLNIFLVITCKKTFQNHLACFETLHSRLCSVHCSNMCPNFPTVLPLLTNIKYYSEKKEKAVDYQHRYW